VRVLIEAAIGPSGARLSGRFCHGSDAIDAGVREHLRAEEALQPDAVFAEIAHLPEGRIGNILCRPVLRDYEIPFLGVSGAPADRQLPIDDLLVSVTDGRIVLRSRRLGREVVPRLTTAHNFRARSLGIYRFLCALQSQAGGGVGWSWGPLEESPFLPRVTCGRAIFQRARWRLDARDLTALAKATEGAKRATTPDAVRELRARSVEAARALRERRGLPRLAVLADRDNELPIDFDNELSADSFVWLVRNRDEAVLLEMLPGPDELVATGAEGSYAHEVVVSFTREREPTRRETPSPVAATVRRRFAPGSDWLYAKLYCGAATGDAVLRDAIAPLVRDVMARGSADSWFFIRYADPDDHIRVRFRGDPDRLLVDVLPVLRAATEPLVDADIVWKLQLDTYEREVERYGGPRGIELAEDLFRHDSDAVLAIVELLEGDAGQDARWRLALRGADHLLDDFGYDLGQKRAIMRRAREAFAAEHRADTRLKKQLGVKFRAERDRVAELLDRAPNPDHDLSPGFDALARRAEAWRDTIAEIRARDARGELRPRLDVVVWSYIHMHANRLLRSAHRAQEMVLYDLLARTYDQQRATR
jgi:thiopeptide-type bacteriocin biosynthesis protein